MNCLNVKNPLVQQELSKLSAILGDASAAYAALALNNGFGLDKAKNGQPSKLFESIKAQLQYENPYLSEQEIYALSIQKKAACYTTEFREWFGDWLNSSDDISLEMSDQIDLVFARNPELAKIGSKQEYAAYLNSIYPNSVDKSIYWHGSNSDFSQGFDSAVRGKGSGSPHITGEFYLAKQAWTVLQYVNGINRSFGPDINGFNHWNKLWWELKEIMSNGRRHNNDWKDLVIGPEHVRQAIPNKHGLFNRDSGGTNGKWLTERKADYGYQDRTDAEFFKDVFGIEYGKDTFNTWTQRNAEIFQSLQSTAEGIYPAIINTQSPIMEFEQNTYYEPERGLFTQAKTNGNDAILGANTDNEFHSDVAVVLNPDQQVHFLGTKQDLANFQQWVSKNGVSKVVDENGEPLMVYTGTPVKGIEEFSLEVEQRHNLTSLLDRRIYFTNYKYIADEYTQGKVTYYTTPEVNEEQARLINAWYWSGELADIPSNQEAIKIAEQQIGLSYKQIRQYIDEHINEYTGELDGFHMEIGEVIPAFLNIKNPAIIQHNGTSIANLTPSQIKEINAAEGAIILNVDEAHVGDYMSQTTNDYLVKSSNQIKSALHNKGSYSKNSKNIYYQVSLAQELKKLSSYNRPLGPAGNAKKQREILLKTGASREVVDLILELLKRNPSLGKFTPVEILRQGTKAQNDAIASDYYYYIQQPVEHALEQHLIQYLSKYGIEVREDSPLLKEHGVTGAYDIINKIIHIAKEGDRNAITLTEEFAHAFVELMGVVPNTNRKGEIIPDLENSPHNYDISLLLKEVEKTSIYQKVFNEYKDVYTTPNGQPDILKIKKEAIGQALAVAIQNNWNIQQGNESKGFWQILKEWWYSIISRFKDAEYLNFDTLINQIAKEVLNNDTSRLDKVDSSNYQLLKYTDTIVNQNTKDGGKALGFMRYFTEIGNVITGSLSYRMQGEVYRGALDSLHDIDMIVPKSVHGIDLQSDEIKSIVQEINRRRYGGVKDNTDLLIQFPYFHRIVTMYPKLKLGSCFASNDGSFYTINGVYAEDESLSEKFLSLSGSYSARLEAFTEEERNQIYLFDFFLKPTDAAIETAVYDDQYNLKLAPYETSLKEKQFNMGRAKDIFDYQMWRTYDKFKERYIPEKETLMFQKPKDSKNIYTDPTLKEYVNIQSKSKPENAIWKELGKQFGIKTQTSSKSAAQKVEIFDGMWTRATAENSEGKVFLFGDNTRDRIGGYVPKQTQAVIRGAKNKKGEIVAIGIDTKKDRGISESSYFTDADFGIFKAQVDQAIEEAIASGKTIVIPKAGIGTGKAQLDTRAPKLFKYLQDKLTSLVSQEVPDKSQALFIVGDFNPLNPIKNATSAEANKAISKGTPVYIFDQVQTRKWYQYIPEYQSYISIDTPTLPMNFTGIVTTTLNKVGERAIIQVYEKTVTKNNESKKDTLKETKPLRTLTVEAKNHLALLAYQYRIEELSDELIKERQTAFLNEDPTEQNTVRRLWELSQMRQAELHAKGRDFGQIKQNNEGTIDFNDLFKGIDLRKSIKDSDLAKFTVLYNYKVHPAEIIMPKLYKTHFKLGNRDIAEIDLNFFKKTNPYYYTNLKDKEGKGIKIDALVRTHSSAFNIIISDSLDKPTGVNWTSVNIEVENGWRIDAQGNKMYKIPEGMTYAVYKEPKGQEIIVILNSPLAESQARKLIRSTRNIVSMQLFAENIQPTEEWIRLTKVQNKITTNNKSLNLIDTNTQSPDQIREFLLNIYLKQKHFYTEELANVLYNSFRKSLELISVRIPTQDFQSIMGTKVVALTNDDANNIFVTRWQFWLQGSDLDIDKSYLMGVDISSTGRYNHWSPLADYSSETLSNLSDKLPIPNGKTLVTAKEWYKITDGDPMLIKPILYENSVSFAINEYLEAEKSDKKEKRLQALISILEYTNSHKELEIHKDLIDIPAVKTLIQLVNKHNEHEVTAEESRNIIQKSIMDAALDERNMRASYSPIDVVMKKFQSVLDNIEDANALTRSLDDGGLSIARMQYNNSVGKKDVGIMANGLKAFFALTQYFNQHKHDLDKQSEIGNRFMNLRSYFLSRISLSPGNDQYFSSISDVQFEEVALQQLKTAFSVYLPTVALSESLTFNASDASLLISSLVSLATDNAKELALAKMNASIDLACMHLFLVVMGYNPQEIITFTTSPVFNKVVKALNNSAISGNKIKVRDAIELVRKEPLSQEERYQLEQMRFIYDCAQEMSKIAKLAAINQGVKVDELEMDGFCETIEEVIQDQVTNSISHDGLVIFMENYELNLGIQDIDEPTSTPENETIKLLLKNTHNYITDANPENDSISSELIAQYRERIEDLNERNRKYKYMDDSMIIDMVRFYSDDGYRQFVIDLYDIFKCNFNVLDCISTLPHFNKMLEAFVLSAHTIKTQSSRSRVVLDIAKHSYRGDINNYYIETSKDDEGNHQVRKKAFDKKQFSVTTQRQASSFYDDYILSEWIKEYGDKYSIKYKAGDDSPVTIKITTNKGIVKFAEFMAFDLIPVLKQLYPNNRFLRYIHGDFRSLRRGQDSSYIPKYKFNFDIDSLKSQSDENKSFYVNKDFNDLANLTLVELQEIANEKLPDFYINFPQGGDLTIGELFYLYDRLCSISSFGQNSLDRAFEEYLAKNMHKSSKLIAYQLIEIIRQHDIGLRPDIVFDDKLFTAYCYAPYIRKYMDGEATFKFAGSVNIKGRHLFNLDAAEKQKDAQVILEQFMSNLRQNDITVNIRNTNDSSEFIITSKLDPSFVFVIPNHKNLELSIEGLIYALVELNKQDPTQTKKLVESIEKLHQKKTKTITHLKSHQTTAVYKTFMKHMEKLGVEVKTFSGSPEQHGYVENGVIYLNVKSDITTTPMHELLHLVFGVMKHDSFVSYERVLELGCKSEYAKKLYNDLSTKDAYKNLMDLDLKEEVFCRLIEAIADPNNDLTIEQVFVSDSGDTYYEINNLLNPFISKTFDIDAPKELMLFMKDTISSITSYDSTLFIKRKADSTGYLSEKTKSIQSAKIAKYIEEEMVAKNALKKVEC